MATRGNQYHPEDIDTNSVESLITALPKFHSESSNTEDVEEAEASTSLLHRNNLPVMVVLVLNIVLTVFLVVVVFVDIGLTNIGSMTERNKALYVIGTTLLASSFTYVTSTQTRTLWLRFIDTQLHRGVDVAKMNPLWRTILGVGTLMESLRYWYTSLAFVICGLITTAVVVGVAASPNTYQTSQYYALADSAPYSCIYVSNPINGSIGTGTGWQLTNGSYFNINLGAQFLCPGNEILSLIGNINTLDVSDHAYADQGVAIHNSALGAPASIYTSQTSSDSPTVTLWLNATLQSYQSSLQTTSQCVPVLTANPVSCTQGTNVTFRDGYLNMTASNGCSVSTFPGLAAGKERDGWTASTMCTHGDVGMATLLFGSLNYDALYLAESMGDVDWVGAIDANKLPEPLLYGAVCTMNTVPVIATRSVTLTLTDQSGTAESFARSLRGDPRDCTPVTLPNETFEDPVNDKVRGIAAFGPGQLLAIGLFENIGQPLRSATRNATSSDGTLSIRRPPYAFNNSRNALEDVLGLTSALAMSRITMTGYTGAIRYVGSAMIANTRIGTGDRYALFYSLPSLVSSTILIALLVATRRQAPDTPSKLTELAHFLSHNTP